MIGYDLFTLIIFYAEISYGWRLFDVVCGLIYIVNKNSFGLNWKILDETKLDCCLNRHLKLWELCGRVESCICIVDGWNIYLIFL